MKTYTISEKSNAIFRVALEGNVPTRVIENTIEHYIDVHSKETYGINACCAITLSSGEVFINSALYWVNYTVVEVIEECVWEVRVTEFDIH